MRDELSEDAERCYPFCPSLVMGRAYSQLHHCGCVEGHSGLHRCYDCGLIWREEKPVRARCLGREDGKHPSGYPFTTPVPTADNWVWASTQDGPDSY